MSAFLWHLIKSNFETGGIQMYIKYKWEFLKEEQKNINRLVYELV